MEQLHFGIYGGVGKRKKREYGVSIAVRSKKQIVIEDICQVSPRLMYIECRCYGMKLRVVSAYASQEGRPESEKNSFYEQLNDTCKVNKGFQLVLAGDMNATAEYCVSFVVGQSVRFLMSMRMDIGFELSVFVSHS